MTTTDDILKEMDRMSKPDRIKAAKGIWASTPKTVPEKSVTSADASYMDKPERKKLARAIWGLDDNDR